MVIVTVRSDDLHGSGVTFLPTHISYFCVAVIKYPDRSSGEGFIWAYSLRIYSIMAGWEGIMEAES